MLRKTSFETLLCKTSKWAQKAVGSDDKGGGGGAKGGGKGGGGITESEIDKKLRLLREREQQKSQRDADREKQTEIDRLEKKLNASGNDETEVDDAGNGDSTSLEKLQKIEKSREEDLKYWQAKLKSNKDCGDPDEITLTQK